MDGRDFRVELTVPMSTTASLHLPSNACGLSIVKNAQETKEVGRCDDDGKLELRHGRYVLTGKILT